MQLILRISLFISILCISIGTAFFSCKNTGKNNNTSLLLLGACGEPKAGEAKVYIFRDMSKWTGKLSASDPRGDANFNCLFSSAHFPFMNGKNIRAFISVSGTDQIKDLATGAAPNWPVYGVNGTYGFGVATNVCETKLADSWNDLWSLTSSIDTNLHAAAGIDDWWWSGSNADGTYGTGASCGGWKSNDVHSYGRAGTFHDEDYNWINDNDVSCDGQHYLLCIAF
jgi:hypothetical protein